MYITINQTYGETMNISWYYGLTLGSENILLGNDTNIVNSTQNELFYPASTRSTTYYWRVMADDGTTYINETFSFRTEGYAGVKLPNNNLAIIGVGLGVFGLLALILVLRRRKRD